MTRKAAACRMFDSERFGVIGKTDDRRGGRDFR
jgi:hypothetical protein